MEKYEYDLAFIGTVHSDRFKILRELNIQATSMGLKVFYPYLQSRFIYHYYKFFKREFQKTSITDFKFEKMDAKYIAEITKKTRAIIDIQHPKQSGLTIRTIEMLGLGKKLITTNEDIRNYDFYKQSNICVIDRKMPCVDKMFFSSNYVELDKQVYEYYSISRWCLDVLGEKL